MSQPIRANVTSLFKISAPTMLSILSTHIMMFLDRVLLVRYNLDAMNAAAAAGMAVCVFQSGAIGVAIISEVFVGRHNGAKEFTAIGCAVWQMIWFSIMLFVLAIPLAVYGATLIVPKSLYFYGIPYFQWTIAFSPLMAVGASLSGFYIGIGKTKRVTLSVVVGNIVNLILAVVLIFGIKGLVPSFGVKGAAFATIIGVITQCVLLLCGFLATENRVMYATTEWQFNYLVMWQEMKLGIPQSLGHTIEVAAWAFVFHLLAPMGGMFVSVSTISQSVILTIYFMLEGLQKGVTGIAANIIGSKNIAEIKVLLRSSLKVYAVILCIIAIPLLIIGRQIVDTIFITDHNANELIEQVTIGLRWMFLFCIFDGLVWILVGFLIAGGDTIFVMLVNGINAWLFAIVPMYFFTKATFVKPHMVALLIAFYSLINVMFFIARYRSGKWHKNIC